MVKQLLIASALVGVVTFTPWPTPDASAHHRPDHLQGGGQPKVGLCHRAGAVLPDGTEVLTQWVGIRVGAPAVPEHLQHGDVLAPPGVDPRVFCRTLPLPPVVPVP